MTAHFFFFPPELQLTAFVIFFALQHFGTGLLRLTDQQKLQTPGLLSHKSCLSHVRLRWDPPRAENRTLPYSWMNTSTQTYHTPYYYLQYYLLSIAGHRLTSYLPPLTIIFRWEWKRTHRKCLAQYSVVPKSISHPSKAISAVIKMMEEKRNPSAILADSLSDIMNLEPRYFLVLQMNIKELHSNRINAKPALAQRSFAKLLFTHFRNMIPINEAANT